MLNLIKEKKLFEYYRANSEYLSIEDVQWLVKQAETLQKIANRWVEIETNGMYEEANDFYTFVQDTLSQK